MTGDRKKENLAPAPTRRADIDGLRAVAILSVLAYHAFPEWLPGGFVGVDIFFVISGFLITLAISRAERAGEGFAYFYVRRAWRILPALLVVVAASLAFGWFTLLSREYSPLGRHAVASVASVANFVFWDEVGYFDDSAAMKPLLHLWSLGVEMQMYLLWPALLFAARRLGKIRGAALISLLAVASAASSFFLLPATAFYLPIARFWEFAAGALVALFPPTFSRLNVRQAVGFGGLALTLGGFAVAAEGGLPLLDALITVAGVSAVIAAGAASPVSRLLAVRPLPWIGRISYSLYLWHWPLLSLALIVRSREALPAPARVALLAVAFALAALTYRFVEAPLMRARGRRAGILLFLVAVAVAGSGFFVWRGGVPSRLPAEEALVRTMRRGENKEISCVQRFGDFGDNSYCLSSGDVKPHVFFLGDSAASAVYRAYVNDLTAGGYSAVYLARGGCPFPLPESFLESGKSASGDRRCNEVAAIYAEASSATDLRAVVIAHDGWYDKKKFFVEGMKEQLASVPEGVPVFWFLRAPRPPLHFAACASRPLSPSRPESCVFPQSRPDEDEYRRAVEEVLAAFPDVVTVDPSPAFCDGELCRAFAGEEFFYTDPRHLSLAGSARLSEAVPFESVFAETLPNLAAAAK